jgi:hypothetical protein
VTTLCRTHNSPPADGRCEFYRATYRAAVDAHFAQQRPGTYGEPFQHPEDLADCIWDRDAWKEPHEGIRGVLRDQDDLLSLEPQALARRQIIIAIAFAFHDIASCAQKAPKAERIGERFGRLHGDGPEIGDLVIEATTLYGNKLRRSEDTEDFDRANMGFGILVAHRWEWWETHEEYDAMRARQEPEDLDYEYRATDHAWYIQYGPQPGDICRWTNCSFMALPTDREQVRSLSRPAHERTETGGVVFTRESLIGALSDSGFELRRDLT